MALEQTMPLDQALSLIDQALGQLNANRETHALLAASVQHIKNELESQAIIIIELQSSVQKLSEQLES